jgi:hypothetical protein
MTNLPTQDLRSNIGTWAVPDGLAPGVAYVLTDTLPIEPYDPGFRGQDLETTYFDTAGGRLRKARLRGNKYLTLRIRRYLPRDDYALSVKTEDQKFRIPMDQRTACSFLDPAGFPSRKWGDLLPGNLLARLLDLAGDEPVCPSVTIFATRFAVEDDNDRLTLDMNVRTDTGICLSANVLEFKSTRPGQAPPDGLLLLGLRPIKLSKFLWSTDWR